MGTRGFVALLIGLVALTALGVPVLRYVADAGAEVLIAVITALTPP
jgi:hypothetical protein